MSKRDEIVSILLRGIPHEMKPSVQDLLVLAFEAGLGTERSDVLAYLRDEDLSSDPRDLKVCRWAAEDIEKGIHQRP